MRVDRLTHLTSWLHKEFDIIGLTETHAVDQSIELTGYTSFQLNRQCLHENLRGSGGIAVLFKNELFPGISRHKTSNENILWIKLKKSFFHSSKDIYLGTAYFSPVNYEKDNKLDYLRDLENDLIQISALGKIVLMGDLNSRTGTLQDVLDQNNILESNDLDLIDRETRPYLKQINSQDKTSDKRGEKLVELCSSLEMCILNGKDRVL